MTVPRDRRSSSARTRKGCVAASLVLALFIATSASAAPSSTPSPTWGTNGYVRAVALSGTTAYVGGSFDRVAANTGGFARVDPVQGAPAPGSPPVLGAVLAAVPDGAGGWYLGGGFRKVGDVPRTNLAHVLSDGTVDPDWAPTTNGMVRALARVGGVVYAGGDFSQVNGGTGRTLIAGFDADTGAVTDFAPTLSGPGVFDIAIAGGGLSGPIVVAGGSFLIGSAAISNLAAFRTTGELLNFAPNPDGRVVALAQRSGQLSETIYVAGQFSNAGGQPRSGLASFENFANIPTSWDPTFGPTPSALERAGSTIYVGGENQVRGFSADAPAAATGFSVQVPEVSQTQEVSAITAMAGDVYVGGSFFEAIPGDGRGHAAAFDGQTGALEDWGPAPSGPVHALESDGTSVVLGGSFTTVGGLRRSLAQIDLLTGRPTDFAAHGLPEGPANRPAPVTAAAVHGSTLYVAVAALPNRVFALDAATGSRLGFEAGFNGRVDAIAVSGSTVFVAGNFTLANGVPRNRVASFQAAPGTAGALLPANPNFDGPVTALVLRQGTLYAGGDFTKVNGSVPRRGLAALDPVSGTATAFDAGLDGAAYALALDGSTLYVGGGFAHAAGTVERDRAAAFDTATGSLTAFAPDLDGAVTTLAVADSTVFAAGPSSGAFNSPFLALLDSASGEATGVNLYPSDVVAAIASSPEAGVVMGGRFTSLEGVPAVASHFAAFATAPGAPPQPVATAGEASATVEFEAAPSGGAPITSYTVTASPGGQTATGAGSPITVPGLVNGTTYTFTVSATNRVGTGQASAASNAVTPGAPSAVQPQGGSGVPAAGSGVPAEATDVAPRIRGLRVTNRRWALARRRTPPVAAVRRGTTFIFTLSEDARTSIRIERAVAGRRRGRRCVKPQPGLRRRCTRFVAAITLTRANTRSGVNRVRFTGRVGRRKLAPGRYRATVVATDGAGNRSAPRSVRFTVVR